MICSDSSIVPPLIYSLLASSREIVIGSVAVDSLLISSMIRKLKDPVLDSTAYTQLVLTATFLVGVFQVVFGLFRSVLPCYSHQLNCLLDTIIKYLIFITTITN